MWSGTCSSRIFCLRGGENGACAKHAMFVNPPKLLV